METRVDMGGSGPISGCIGYIPPMVCSTVDEQHAGAILQRLLDAWGKVIRSYKPVKAFDCVGWSLETFLLLAHDSSTMPVFKAICQGMLTMEIDRCLLPYLTMRKRVGLFKGAEGNIRRSSVQTMFRNWWQLSQ